ncbi:AEC family transporter [Microbacterium sp. EYE_5]|uniref:AEC family transporter n=1 Tax=unclassified Microbacterium TaxID=2609290 RepID=UPI002006C619|nr:MULTISPECIES: AEC family transporter [unclassified Microbacterium]MCK6080795.1 AEC family transporter [Microbacterium sp. EYE_382]MCK6086066.1 AEC family transporter [Microbacterium sp. EYE_384]MCK6124436.1 AEC family transporter [Microbacterium sp. EYE_80]MCK6127345.1 AEC family transporter [Microbacterium sp. EYE_79]MCK6141750.1 AEC family transporter [Microbacterium sp. EYE_39]
MLEVLTGFVVIGVAILVGWIIGRIDLLGPTGGQVLSRLTFFVLSPFLLFVVLSQADVATLFSALLPVSAITAFVVFALFTVVSRFVWRRPAGEVLIGALSAGQVNSNNIGIPLSLYLLGSAAFPAPVILFQLLVLTPITMAIFEALTSPTGRRPWPIIRRTVSNPIVIGSVLGTVVSATGIPLPAIVIDPLELVANAAVPVLLISYGISLNGQRVLGTSGRRRDILLASGLKLFAMPLIAWAIAAFAFRLSPAEILVVTVLAALPTAQNVFNYAQRYATGQTLARDTVFVTTIGCVPVLFLVVILLGPAAG